jgi:hypothetical protein
MMKKTIVLSLILCAAGCTTVRSYNPRPDALWPLVAKSHVIVTGTLDVPVDQIRSCLTSNRHAYAEINVTRDETLKGNPPESFVVRWHTEPRDYAPDPKLVIALDGKRALLFFANVEDAPTRGYYFAGYTPRALAVASETLIEHVQHEAFAQQKFLGRFSEVFPPAEEPLYDRIKGLIDATTRKDSQMAAFRELEQLGPKAVPAIIMLMDDRRDLAIPSISLRNKSSDAFERIRHHKPKKIVDAMAAILNQITGHSFGTIDNSGSERERQATIDGWRVYLYHWKKETEGTGKKGKG